MRTRQIVWATGLVGLAVALAACSGTAGGGATAGGTATPAATRAAASVAAPKVTASGVANTLDPCQLVTPAEASALAGVTYGAGLAEDTGQGAKRCTYGAQTKQVFWVQTAAATDAAAAQAAWASEQSAVQAQLTKQLPAGVTLNTASTDVSGIGDRAAVLSGSMSLSGVHLSMTSIYTLKGPDFLAFGVFEVGGSAAGASAFEAQAQTSLGRMP